MKAKATAGSAQAAASRGAQVETIDLRSLALPLYDGDLEKGAGVPEGAAGQHGVPDPEGGDCPDLDFCRT